MTIYERQIESLESEWSPGDGFFWHLREGRFSAVRFDVLLKKIMSISVPENAALPRRFVSLLWYMPIFMHWQIERVRENGGDDVAYQRAIGLMTAQIERLLGVP